MFKKIIDFIFFPFRILLSHEANEKLGLTSLRQERANICKKFIKGMVLDIGCGSNGLIKDYKNGYGVDPYPVKGVDVCARAEAMPFKDATFDRATYMVSLRYSPDMPSALKETNRVLKPGSEVIILENSPFMNVLRHSLTFWQKVKGEKVTGLTEDEIKEMLAKSGFKYGGLVKYLYGMGRLYIGKK